MKFLRLLPLALITALSACHHQADTAEAATPLRAVRAVVVATGPAEAPIVATGLLATRDEVQLGFKTGGVVRRIAVRGGDAVHAGDVLAQIELAEVDAGLAQARAAYEKAARDQQRGDRLFDDDVITREQLDDLGPAAPVARAQQNGRGSCRERVGPYG